MSACKMMKRAAPRVKVAGMVKSQANTMLPATVQFTFLAPPVKPTPMMELAATWVVDTGKPKDEAEKMMEALVRSAAKPLAG